MICHPGAINLAQAAAAPAACFLLALMHIKKSAAKAAVSVDRAPFILIQKDAGAVFPPRWDNRANPPDLAVVEDYRPGTRQQIVQRERNRVAVSETFRDTLQIGWDHIARQMAACSLAPGACAFGSGKAEFFSRFWHDNTRL